jgi:myo-inositol-1(or 4)-monophosphatase
VAAGFSDGFFETGLKAWDVAAGSLLITEAGGLVGNFTGEADFLHQGECVSGNPRIYAQLVNVLGSYSKFAGVADKLQVAAKEAAKEVTDEAPQETSAEGGADAAAPAERVKTVLRAPKRAQPAEPAGAPAAPSQGGKARRAPLRKG